MKRSTTLTVAIVLFLIVMAFFVFGTLPQDRWSAYPDGIIVDTQEEFMRKNTP